MTRRSALRLKPSLNDAMRANERALNSWADMAGKPRKAIFSDMPAVPEKRERRKPADGKPLERDIQRAILDYLHRHPKVATVGRFNSGAAMGTYNNRVSYTRFNTIPGFPDIHGLLKGGRALYIEVKRPGQKPTAQQAAFLQDAAYGGALAFVATSVEDVMARMEGA